jgi:hypothetical protein
MEKLEGVDTILVVALALIGFSIGVVIAKTFNPSAPLLCWTNRGIGIVFGIIFALVYARLIGVKRIV